MILTVTLNTSVDKLYFVDKVVPETVMRVGQVSNTAGGKGLNVSRVARLCGGDVTAIGFIGGFNGAYIESMLKDQGIQAAFTRMKGESRSCINIRDLSTGKHTEYLEPGAEISASELEMFFADFRKSLPSAEIVTVSGSLPKGVGADCYARIIREAKALNKPVILDTSGQALQEAVKAGPSMIKPNVDEMEFLLGKTIDSRDEVIAAAEKLHRGGIAYVVVSLGKEGSLMVCGEGVFQGITPDIPVVNTVGCGDSMVAGFAVGMTRGYGPEEMLSFATAVSTANALSLQTGYFEQEDLERLLTQVSVKKLT